jgi:hypothetical protein
MLVELTPMGRRTHIEKIEELCTSTSDGRRPGRQPDKIQIEPTEKTYRLKDGFIMGIARYCTHARAQSRTVSKVLKELVIPLCALQGNNTHSYMHNEHAN